MKMTTGSFTDWAGVIADIGPIYPFVGSEGFLVIAGLVYWIAWHVAQLKKEAATMKEEDDYYQSGGS